MDQRGVELPRDMNGMRRPRTAFASFARSRGVELADSNAETQRKRQRRGRILRRMQHRGVSLVVVAVDVTIGANGVAPLDIRTIS